jgi:hypothetical protein
LRLKSLGDDGSKRLQITIAQIQQALPGLKRDGSTVLSAVTAELLHDETSTTRAGGVLIQSDFIRGLSEKIQEAPEEVIEEFENIRRIRGYFRTTPSLFCTHQQLPVTDPTGVRFSVTGNVLSVPKPRSTWNKYFGAALPVSRRLQPPQKGSLTQFGYLRRHRCHPCPWHPIH